jgi:XRE family aerobic/anaerobic benzoate catabolism transcriptional regulator
MSEAPPILRRLAERMRSRRLELALTIKELASRAGVSQRFLVSVEAAKGNISVVKLDQVAGALETTPAELLAEDHPVAASDTRGGLVALLGLRGAGKSSIGASAAERLDLPFIELDTWVVDRAGMELSNIFELHGQDYYRRLERRALDELVATPRAAIVATGGSIVTSHDTFDLLRKHATTIWLRASPDDHWDRVVAQGDARPMANREGAMDELRSILRARRALYERADHVVDTSALGLERSIAAVVKLARDHALAA